MSYARWHEGDVYVIASSYEDGTPFWNCINCSIGVRHFYGMCEVSETMTGTRQKMLDHLLEHQKRGDKVPERTFKRLRKEIAEEA